MSKKIIKLNEYINNKDNESNEGLSENLMNELINSFSFNMLHDEDFQKKEKSDDYLFKAYESNSVEEKIRLAKKAIKIYPTNIDAMNVITQYETDLEKKLKSYKKTLKIAEDILKEDDLFSKEDIGHFWGIMETRPYMRTRHGYMMTLLGLKRYEEAVKECEEMLRLCLSDNMGIRYILMGLYVYLNEYKKSETLYNNFEDCSFYMTLPMSIAKFRQQDKRKAKKYIVDANEDNENVIPYMKGEIKLSKKEKEQMDNLPGILAFSVQEVYKATKDLGYLLKENKEYLEWIKETKF